MTSLPSPLLIVPLPIRTHAHTYSNPYPHALHLPHIHILKRSSFHLHFSFKQSAVPISMVISRISLKVKYGLQHYIGALIVAAGLVVVLVPTFVDPPKTDDSDSSISKPSPAIVGMFSSVFVFVCR